MYGGLHFHHRSVVPFDYYTEPYREESRPTWTHVEHARHPSAASWQLGLVPRTKLAAAPFHHCHCQPVTVVYLAPAVY